MGKIVYELHVTVDGKGVDVKKFKNDCKKLGVKPVLIALQDKAGVIFDGQLMTSSRVAGETDDVAYKEVKRIANGLMKMGYNVIREKIEASPNHPEVDKLPRPRERYLESHLQVITNKERLKKLGEIARKHNAHLSRNAFKELGDEFINMLTLRDWNSSLNEFEKKLDNLIKDLNENGFKLAEQPEIEFSIYDTRYNLDDEWLNKN